VKYEVKHIGLLEKILTHFTTNHTKDVFGDRIAIVPFKKGKQRQRRKHLHCQYLKNIQLQILKGIENLCKQTEFRYEDGRKSSRKFTSILSELRSMCIPFPDPEKPETTVARPIFMECIPVTVMIVSDRAEAWSVYEKMSKCTFA
jgi:hypothetical protein